MNKNGRWKIGDFTVVELVVIAAICLGLGVLLMPLFEWFNEFTMDSMYVPDNKDVLVSVSCNVNGTESQDEIRVQPGDIVCYTVHVENHGERGLIGYLIFPCPVLDDIKVSISDDGFTDESSVLWLLRRLPSGESVDYQVTMTIPDAMSVTNWNTQAYVHVDNSQGERMLLSENIVRTSFGTASVCYRMEQEELVVWNEETANGAAASVVVTIPVKEGEEIASDEWVVEDGNVVISCGALVPGGEKNIDLSNIIDCLETGNMTVTYDGGMAEMR